MHGKGAVFALEVADYPEEYDQNATKLK